MREALSPPATHARLEGGERLWWLLSTAGLAAVYTLFAIIHLQLWMQTGHPVGLGVVFQESLIVVLFVTRRRPTVTSRAPLAWIATGVGAFGVLALRPGGEAVAGLPIAWAGLQVIAAVGYVSSLGFLGRSFGIVPAHRGLRTGGPYRWVRHPVYAAYLLGSVGYLLESPTAWNLGVIAVHMLGQVVRMRYEEQVLSSDPAYVAYRERVRWRLLPYVY